MSEIVNFPLEPIQATRPSQSTIFKRYVRPDLPPPDRKIVLSTIDQIAPRVYNYGLHPFRLDEGSSKADIFRTLEHGLRAALTEFPEFTGKIVPVDSPRDGLGIEIDDHGVLFQMLDCTLPENAAVWPYGTFRDLERTHFSVTQFPTEVFCPAEIDDNAAGLRCMYAQVTFVEGGMILSYCYHHVASDGPGGSHWLKAWARHTDAISRSQCTPIREKPKETFFYRAPIDDNRVDTVKLKEFPAWKLAYEGPLMEGAIPTRSVGLTGVDPVSPLDGDVNKPMICMWHIPQRKVNALKAAVAGNRGRVGTNEVLCAFLWRHISMARRLHHSEHKTSVLSTTVDLRKAMGLHTEFAGNACEPNAYTRLSINKLCRSGWDGLYDVAQELKSNIKKVDTTAVRRLVGLLKQMPSATHLTWNCNRWPGPDMLISSLLEAGWTNLQWGPLMGQSEVGRFLVGPNSPIDGRVFILPRSQDGRGVEIMVRYPQEIQDRLLADPTWTSFCELWDF